MRIVLLNPFAAVLATYVYNNNDDCDDDDNNDDDNDDHCDDDDCDDDTEVKIKGRSIHHNNIIIIRGFTHI